MTKVWEIVFSEEDEMNEKRSILDNMEIKEQAFGFPLTQIGPQRKSIVGHCPACGSPIYGLLTITSEKPEIVYSCTCRSKTISDTMMTK